MTMTYQEAAEALLSQTYVFAKTMPHIPHHYVVRKNWQDRGVTFDDIVSFIRERGYGDTFGGKEYRYLNVNGLRYWTMGAPVEETIVLNRAVIPRNFVTPYDSVAETYDEQYAGQGYEEENAKVFDYVPVEVDSLLDIGCGTGLALDYISPVRYVGFDPSYQMIETLGSKFQFPEGSTFDVFKAGMSEFHLPEKFQWVLCLFGVANYLTADELRRIPDYVAPGGTYIVMLQNPGYTPLVHGTGQVSQPIYDHPLSVLPGDVVRVSDAYSMIVSQKPAVRRRTRCA